VLCMNTTPRVADEFAIACLLACLQFAFPDML